MEFLGKKKGPNLKLRFNFLSILVYLIGAVLILQLFNLQIVNGTAYRETSNTRLTRESTLYAARGNILDRNGTILASSEMTFSLDMYKTKLENDVLNNTIIEVIKTLEVNGDTYIDTLPITINPYAYNFASEEKKLAWLKSNNLKPETTAESAFNYFKDKYEITQENIEDVRKILNIRYRISSEGYSATKSLTISDNISRKSALIFDEQSDKYPGIDAKTNAKRNYPNGNIAPHILGYIGSINPTQYEANKDKRIHNE